jgi:methyltransferase family protein
MRHIRPYKIFTLLEAPAPERIVNVALPRRRGSGGTSLLETMLIIAATRIVDARRVFEIGTFLGSNTLNMALNLPDDAKVFTLDLDEQHAVGLEQLPEDAPLTKLHLASQSSLDFTDSAVAGKISTLIGNSTTFDFSAWRRSVDFSFIDGGHDYATVKSDTENALEMAAIDKPSCIMWHDYRSWEYPALTCYLDDLAKEREIFHVEDTTLCAWFNDPNGSIVPRLMN